MNTHHTHRQWPATMADKQAIADRLCQAADEVDRRAEAAVDVIMAIALGLVLAMALAHWWAA